MGAKSLWAVEGVVGGHGPLQPVWDGQQLRGRGVAGQGKGQVLRPSHPKGWQDTQ